MLRLVAFAGLLLLALGCRSLAGPFPVAHHDDTELSPFEPVKHGAIRVSQSVRVAIAFQRARQLYATLGTSGAAERPLTTAISASPLGILKPPPKRGPTALFRPRARSALEPAALG